LGEVYVRSVRHGRDIVVAVCDAELLGKTLKGGKTPFVVSERFYKGTLCDLTEAIEAICRATIVNIVGKKIVKAAIEKRMIRESAVIYIGETPHAQIVHL
jgi:hypothetical protein